jgi:hypothetical protein
MVRCISIFKLPALIYRVPEADSDIHLSVIYAYRFKPPEKMYVRFNRIEVIIYSGWLCGVCVDDAADMGMDRVGARQLMR